MSIRWLRKLDLRFLRQHSNSAGSNATLWEFGASRVSHSVDWSSRRNMRQLAVSLIVVIASWFLPIAAFAQDHDAKSRSELHTAIVEYAIELGVLRPYKKPMSIAISDEVGDLKPDTPTGRLIRASISDFESRCRASLNLVTIEQPYDIYIRTYFQYVQVMRETGSRSEARKLIIRDHTAEEIERKHSSRKHQEARKIQGLSPDILMTTAPVRSALSFESHRIEFKRYRNSDTTIGREWNGGGLLIPSINNTTPLPINQIRSLYFLDILDSLPETNEATLKAHAWFKGPYHKAILEFLGYENTGKGEEFDDLLCRLRQDDELPLYLDIKSFRQQALLRLKTYSHTERAPR